jgi:hypothetical protein
MLSFDGNTTSILESILKRQNHLLVFFVSTVFSWINVKIPYTEKFYKIDLFNNLGNGMIFTWAGERKRRMAKTYFLSGCTG